MYEDTERWSDLVLRVAVEQASTVEKKVNVLTRRSVWRSARKRRKAARAAELEVEVLEAILTLALENARLVALAGVGAEGGDIPTVEAIERIVEQDAQRPFSRAPQGVSHKPQQRTPPMT